jgi:hypothetical protein
MDVTDYTARDIASRIANDAEFDTTTALVKNARATYDLVLLACSKAKRDAMGVYNAGARTASDNRTYMSVCEANDAMIDTAMTEYDRVRDAVYYQANEAAGKAYDLVYETAKSVFATIYCPAHGAHEALYDKWDTLRHRYPDGSELGDVEDALSVASKALTAAKDKAYKAAFDAATALYNTTKD